MSRPCCLRLIQHETLMKERMPLSIFNIKLEQTEPVLTGQIQCVCHRAVGLALRSKVTVHHRVAVVGQCPAEGDMILQIKEVIAVGYGQAY